MPAGFPFCTICQVERHTGEQYFKRMSLKECLKVSVDRCAIFFRKVRSMMKVQPLLLHTIACADACRQMCPSLCAPLTSMLPPDRFK
jgi:hypothetical protein